MNPVVPRLVGRPGFSCRLRMSPFRVGAHPPPPSPSAARRGPAGGDRVLESTPAMPGALLLSRRVWPHLLLPADPNVRSWWELT
jgi:hypothetical protein